MSGKWCRNSTEKSKIVKNRDVNSKNEVVMLPERVQTLLQEYNIIRLSPNFTRKSLSYLNVDKVKTSQVKL